MDFHEWRAMHQGTLFVMVDGGANSALIQRFYELGCGEAYPLFAGTPFAEQAALGPWLLRDPSAEFVTSYPTLSGFYLISDQPIEVVRHHWQSLIEVIREGETAWFHILPHHLAALYDESRHAYILRRRLWQAMTTMMERHPNPEDVILPVLKRANRAGLQDDIRDGVVAGALTLQVGLPLDSIQVPLALTEDELAQVENWLNKHDDVTGAR